MSSIADTDTAPGALRRIADAIRSLFAGVAPVAALRRDLPFLDHRRAEGSSEGGVFRAARLATIGLSPDPHRL